MFIHVGMAHIYGDFEWNDEQMRLKIVSLRSGSWFGDYQIMLGQASNWDLEAGGDHELKNVKKPLGMPPNHVMIYKLDAEILKKTCNWYPRFRQHLVTRSLLRRQSFIKAYEDNKQIVLLKRKQEEHAKIAEAMGIKNDFNLEPKQKIGENMSLMDQNTFLRNIRTNEKIFTVM